MFDLNIEAENEVPVYLFHLALSESLKPRESIKSLDRDQDCQHE